MLLKHRWFTTPTARSPKNIRALSAVFFQRGPVPTHGISPSTRTLPPALRRAHHQSTVCNHTSSSSTDMLSPSTDPLVWIDCEMTGLNPETDVILQIVCFITSSSLDLLEPTGLELVIHYPKSVLDQMGPWCQETHARTGLTQRVLASTTTPEEAAAKLLAYIKAHVPKPRSALLAGNSIHADRMFLAKLCPEILEHLHYRIMDVSTLKECARRWSSKGVRSRVPQKKGLHEARADVLESIEEMRYYKKVFFDRR
ncbi:ribonuclease H-like domain-containing protein [Kalaharituber pfeilii]|nr:ribonuclease H-like domain-containing protein [Kalaharituber pfeilii]